MFVGLVDLKIAELAWRLVCARARRLVSGLALLEEGLRSILVCSIAFEVADEVRSCKEIFILIRAWTRNVSFVSLMVHEPTPCDAELRCLRIFDCRQWIDSNLAHFKAFTVLPWAREVLPYPDASRVY